LGGCCLIITPRSPWRYRRKRLIKRLNRPAISDSEKQPRISTRRAVSTNRASRLLRSLPILCPESLLTCLPADDSVSPSSRTRCSLLRIWPRPRADPEDSSHLEGEMIRVCSGNCESNLFLWAVAYHRRIATARIDAISKTTATKSFEHSLANKAEAVASYAKMAGRSTGRAATGQFSPRDGEQRRRSPPHSLASQTLRL